MSAARLRLGRLALITVLGLGAGALGLGLWIPAKAELAQRLMNRAWHATRADRRHVKPWPWADTWPVARLTLREGREPLIVLAGASGRNLAFGPAHVHGSALPGHAGVSVIAGHRDTHFRALERLAAGDRIEIEQPDGRTDAYEIVATDVVDARETSIRLLDGEPSSIVLVTCWPFDALVPGGPLRYVVTATRDSSASGSRHAAPSSLRRTAL